MLTLHDLVLHHLLPELTLAGDSADPYLEALAADHGWVGRGRRHAAALGRLQARAALSRCPPTAACCDASAASWCTAAGPPTGSPRRSGGWRCAAVSMGIPLPPAVGVPGGPEARAARRALGLPEERPLLGSFGFQTPIKRTVAALAALARPELAGVGLLVVGEVSPHVDLEGEARRLGVADRVHVTGFVDAADLPPRAAACDLALNLRYPTAGETSASLLRLLAAGRPALVSDYAQFRDLPPSAVLRVPLGDEETEALGVRAAALLADPARLRSMGQAARDHVALHHTPRAAAAAVAAACAELAELPSPAAGRRAPSHRRRCPLRPPSPGASRRRDAARARRRRRGLAARRAAPPRPAPGQRRPRALARGAPRAGRCRLRAVAA